MSPRLYDTAMSSCIHCGTTHNLLESSPLNPKIRPHSAANTAETFQRAATFSPTPENIYLLLLLGTITPMSSDWLTACRICLHRTESYKIPEGIIGKCEVENQKFPLIYPKIDCYIQCLHACTQKNGLLSSKDPEGGPIDQNSQNKAKHPFLLFPRRQHEWCICCIRNTELSAARNAVATAAGEPPPSDCQEVQYTTPKKKATQRACFLKRS